MTGTAGFAARAVVMADLGDLAEEATRVLGGGRAARLDPDALTSLADAALALGADSLMVYRAEASQFSADQELIEEVAEIEDATGCALHEAQQLRAEIWRELTSARAALTAALAALAAARLMPAVTSRQQGARQAVIERAQ